MSKKFSHLYDTFLIRPANSVFDNEFRKVILEKFPWKTWFDVNYPAMNKQQDEYLKYYPEWIASSKLNQITGLEQFPYRHLINGVTQMLDEFHFQALKSGKKIRLYRGEYPYNREVIDWNWDKDFIDDRPLEKGDAVIISCPFSATGNKPAQWDFLLDQCYSLNIPVAVDCAFFGTCGNIQMDLSHPSIERVAFSLTKGLGTGYYRSGIEFSKDHKGHLAIQNDWYHNLHLNAAIGLFLMQEFSPDYLFNKYRKAQEDACADYGIDPTPCIHLATGGKDWKYFQRDQTVNRIGIKFAVKKKYKELMVRMHSQ